ncbi:unnamed protein product [Ectocarpus sp. CCAP 1310/34]|nr:unnamed protein product [Ectocarpus sp. CCAP 1310/34]
MLLVAPLSANTLSKLANGLCDNLVTCVARAWDFKSKKSFVVAPAMNTHMWEHPMTNRHLSALTELGVAVVPPASKKLACGDVLERWLTCRMCVTWQSSALGESFHHQDDGKRRNVASFGLVLEITAVVIFEGFQRTGSVI